jgi:amidohydrolase
MKAEEIKIRVENLVESLQKEFAELSKFIYDNPELGYEEFKSSKAHIDLLRKHGFTVEEGYLGINTAFRAEYDSKKEGPTIGYLAEYDALPEIGHGCGHNILGTTSTGAGIVLSKLIDDIGGKVVVFGTPAEETSGAKVEMANRGAFNNIDAALIVHPAAKFEKSGSSLAMEAIQFTFKGKTAHAAASPEKGINALDAVIQLFNGINALRQHVTTDVRIHGIITHGGEAPNIVPGYAKARFFIRAATRKTCSEVTERVKAIAQGAALATGAKLNVIAFQNEVDNLLINKVFDELFVESATLLGLEIDTEVHKGSGSTDAGNISQVVPTIHPHIKIGPSTLVGHTKEFCDAAASREGDDALIIGAKALAVTALSLFTDKDKLQEIKDEFNRVKTIS